MIRKLGGRKMNELREEEMRIQEIRTARMSIVRDVIREARIEVPKLLTEIEKKYIVKIDEEYKVDMKIFRDNKEREIRRR